MDPTFSKERTNGNSMIVFFDLDRTITKAISGKALVRASLKKGLLKRSDLIIAFFSCLLFRLNLKDPQKIIDDMIRRVEGLNEKTMNDLCVEVSREVLIPSVYTEARDAIKRHQEKNAKVVILSSAITYICREVAKNIGIDDVICTDLEVREGYLTGHSIGPICFGKEKGVRLSKYCEKNNTELTDAWYYGDSISDLPALVSVGNPVCINPDKKLEKEALERGWKILFWR